MIKVCIYTLTLIIGTIICIRVKKNILGTFLCIIYSAVGVFAILCVQKGMLRQYLDTSILPYAYLLIIYSISFFPYIDSEGIRSSKFSIDLYTQYYIFSYIYIATAMVTIFLYITPVRDLIASGRWFDNIEAMYAGKTVYPYNNFIEYLCIQFSGYTRILALLIGFAMLRKREDIVKGLVLLATAVISGVLTALYISSRGIIANLIMLIMSIYLFYHNEYENKVRKRITIVLSTILVLLLPLLSVITISRFTNEAASDSIIQYFGQAPIVFSGGVSIINKYSYGVNGFGTLFGEHISQANIGGTWGSGFYTYVGWIFLDWGPFGTLALVSLISVILWYLINKDVYELSDLYLIFFVYYTLLQGVFVIGSTYCYQIVIALVIYFGLKVFSDNKEYYIYNVSSTVEVTNQSKYIKSSKAANNSSKYLR